MPTTQLMDIGLVNMRTSQPANHKFLKTTERLHYICKLPYQILTVYKQYTVIYWISHSRQIICSNFSIQQFGELNIP